MDCYCKSYVDTVVRAEPAPDLGQSACNFGSDSLLMQFGLWLAVVSMGESLSCSMPSDHRHLSRMVWPSTEPVVMTRVWQLPSTRRAAAAPVQNAEGSRNGCTAVIAGAWRTYPWQADRFGSWSRRGDFVARVSSAGDISLPSELIATCWPRGADGPPASTILSTTSRSPWAADPPRVLPGG